MSRLEYEPQSETPRTARFRLGLLGWGALPLLVYPWCLLANVMSFAGHPNPNASTVGEYFFRAFLWGNTLYPAVYLVALGISKLMSSNDRPAAARRAAIAPLLYLAALLVCFVVGVLAEH